MTLRISLSHLVLWSAATALSFAGCGSSSDMNGTGAGGTTGSAGSGAAAGTTGTATTSAGT